MPSTRIFIGNLTLDVQENDIRERFSPYGTINSIDIKNKLDIEENPVSKFAYLNLEAQLGNVNECVQKTNGSKLKGSVLKVEIAKESFLDRLRREREQAKQPQDNNSNKERNEISYNYNFEKPNQSKFIEKEFNDSNSNSFNKFDNSYNKFDNSYNKYDNSYNKYDKSYNKFDSNEKNNFELSNNKNYNENRNYNRIGDEDVFNEFSTYKRYYPTESEDLKDKKTIEESTIESNEAKKSFVNVYSKLSFKEESSTFSLLDKFSAVRKEEEERIQEEYQNQKLAKLEIFSNEANDKKKVKKNRNFFISSDDPLLESAVDWILTPLTEENQKEFEEVRSSLVEVSRLRDSRAKRDKHLRGRSSKFARINKGYNKSYNKG